jgi:hypothetical protein
VTNDKKFLNVLYAVIPGVLIHRDMGIKTWALDDETK